MPLAPVSFADIETYAGEDDSALLLSSTSVQLLLKLLSNAQSNPDIFFSDYADIDTDDLDVLLDDTTLALMGTPVPSLFGFYRYDFNVLKPDNQSGSFVMNTGFTSQYNLCCLQSTVQNNYFEYKQYLKAGGYSIDLNIVKHSSAGIITLTVDGNAISTHDGYNASNQQNQFVGPSGVTIDADGVVTIRLAMNTKNASSSGYGLIISQLAIRKTS